VSASVPFRFPASWINPLPARLHKPAFGLFLLAAIADGLRQWLGLSATGFMSWLTPGVWLFAALTLLVGFARRLPAQNAVAVAAVAGGLGFLVDLLDATTDIPFGRRRFTPLVEPLWFGVAWFMPLLWIAITVGCRGVARLILRPWRKLTYYGLWVMAVATALSLVLALVFEPFGRAQQWWLRETRPDSWTWYGAPVVSFFGWVVTTLTIYGFSTPWMLNKQPVKQPTDWHPLLVWCGLLLWMTGGNAAAGAWFAVAFGLLAGGTVVVLALRGGRW
jgi:hypothetical protein